MSAAAGTHPGRVHNVDQDNAYAFIRDPNLGKTRGLFIVADGMGGHQAGEVASKLAVDTLHRELEWFLVQSDSEETQPSLPPVGSQEVELQPGEQLGKRLLAAIVQANKAITKYAETHPADAGNLGTTVTCILVDDDRAVVANIGDSRTYVLRNGSLQQITEDHSYVAHLVREGQIAPEEVFVHPRRNVITRSLGYRPEVEVDLWVEAIRPGDRWLLCSDGLWEMVRDEGMIARVMTSTPSPEEGVRQLITAANEQGGADNIGVVLIHVNSVPGDA